MASLKDQFLKAGLIDNKTAKQLDKDKRKEARVSRRTGESRDDDVKEQLAQSRAEKLERDRELNRQRDEAQQQKAIAAQIRQLIENHRQPKVDSKGGGKKGGEDVEHNFTHGKLIKKIRVSPAVQQQIVRGQLAIVALGEGYELVPRIVADKIAQRDAKAVVVLNTPAQAQLEEDDPYKDYVIPDDLMW